MKVSVILGHQNPGSFNHAIASTTLNTLQSLGHEAHYHDLYAEKFDPITRHDEWNNDNLLPEQVKIHSAEIKASDGMIFIHPNWWGTPPAILKGWIDRIFRSGFAYNFTPSGPVQYFTDKTVQVFTTSNTPREVELGVYTDPLENFWKVVVFGLCGCQSFERRNFEPVIMSTYDDRAAWLREVEETVRRRFAL
ncbi:MAG: NAD(P)H-dependent oxidoreductase [Planctomycetaceae bacterium]|jgi:putative NADPH-quinone reductase|nr:NAD(P)H-dependent oxidoreductase [Planctomycetaceae bacterium]